MVYVIIRNTINKRTILSKTVCKFTVEDFKEEIYIPYGNASFQTRKDAIDYCFKYALNLVYTQYTNGIIKPTTFRDHLDTVFVNGNTLEYYTQYAIIPNTFYTIIEMDLIAKENIQLKNHVEYLEHILSGDYINKNFIEQEETNEIDIEENFIEVK
jgi:hypothetical protein